MIANFAQKNLSLFLLQENYGDFSFIIILLEFFKSILRVNEIMQNFKKIFIKISDTSSQGDIANNWSSFVLMS